MVARFYHVYMKVLETYEVWNYSDHEQYDSETKKGGLFTTYINQFLRLKQQADGWPSWVKTDNDKDRYRFKLFMHTFKENFCFNSGVILEKDQVEKNPGMRTLAKLMLNSFWGKVIILYIFFLFIAIDSF
jgi:hypothetical protein